MTDMPQGEKAPGVVVEGLTLGPFETNSYVVYRKSAPGGPGTCWVIDPSFGPGPLIRRVKELGLKPELLVLTHAHVDHIAGVDEVLRAFPGLPVVVHAAEEAWLSDPMLNLGAMGGLPITCRGPDRLLNEGDTLTLDGTRWLVLHTPGHSPGGITLYQPESGVAIVGDTLFAGSVGRTDFPGSDPETLESSIRTKLYRLPPETVIFPGHGPESTIGREMRTNPFVRA
jgi:glyoxylase-like metal-dependent hydrolase (beta-lactamase superfamily II)